MEKEIWKPVVGYENTHIVSNLGNVKALKSEHINAIGRIHRRNEKLISQYKTHWGYLKVDLCIPKSKRRFFVHRLVAEAFIPNSESKPQVNHINGIKDDNRVENLEWCTQSENQKHSIATGLKVIGKGYDSGTSKLNREQVEEIQRVYVFRKTKQIDLAKRYGVSVTTIKKALDNGYIQ